MTTFPRPPLQQLPDMIARTSRQLAVTKQQAVILKSGMSAATPQKWTALTLQNVWANVTGFVPAQWRQFAAGAVEIIGVINGGNIGDGTVIAALPSGFYNTGNAWPVPATILAGASAATALSPLVIVQTSGNLTLSGIPSGTTRIAFHDVVPLNA